MRQLERPEAGPTTGNGLDPSLQGISRCRHTALTHIRTKRTSIHNMQRHRKTHTHILIDIHTYFHRPAHTDKHSERHIYSHTGLCTCTR